MLTIFFFTQCSQALSYNSHLHAWSHRVISNLLTISSLKSQIVWYSLFSSYFSKRSKDFIAFTPGFYIVGNLNFHLNLLLSLLLPNISVLCLPLSPTSSSSEHTFLWILTWLIWSSVFFANPLMLTHLTASSTKGIFFLMECYFFVLFLFLVLSHLIICALLLTTLRVYSSFFLSFIITSALYCQYFFLLLCYFDYLSVCL